jgi:hypothetical protein
LLCAFFLTELELLQAFPLATPALKTVLHRVKASNKHSVALYVRGVAPVFVSRIVTFTFGLVF